MDMSKYSEGQTHQLMEALEAVGFSPEYITRLGQSKTLLLKLLRVLDGMDEIVPFPFDKTKKVQTYLRYLFTFKLGATDDTGTMVKARKVFSYFSSDFESCGIVFSGVAPGTKVAAHELVLHGRFTEFLGGTAKELEKLRLLGSQFLNLCQNNSHKLQRNGFTNFFILTRGDERVAEDLSNVFVASVRVHDNGELNAHPYRVTHDHTWDSEFSLRVFSPQRALVSSKSA
jgi:hypothetical protein